MKTIPIFQVDAFTGEPFAGNPAAVCLLQQPYDDVFLQTVAAEMNLSETAFLLREGERLWEETTAFSLRWFTPRVEVPLCGHATLASAAVLFDEVGVTAGAVTFRTLSGELIARRTPEGILLDFPADPPVPVAEPADALAALGLTASDVIAAARGERTQKLLLHMRDAGTLRELAPDFPALLAAEGMRNYRGLIVTAEGEAHDFVSRYFAPWVGIDEDPVTGSAHTVLTPYWAEQLNKRELAAYQASSRGGELVVRLREAGRVELVGQAVVVLRGDLFI